ncbi:IS3 family transposase [Streptomyces wuyuanensis]|uniref:IS3 family transposase n=1 Tax=Streptomyces wuyuanensis TaxID=1196353 RepID=UPI00372168AA
MAHEITMLHVASRHTYGVPRIHAELRRLDRRVNRKRVERIMRERDIAGVTPAQAPVADPSGEEGGARRGPGRPRLHSRRPGRKLVGDITFIATDEGWLYLATREIVGYSMAALLKEEIGTRRWPDRDHCPRGVLRLHRDLLQPQETAEASGLGLPHPAGDPPTTRARARPRSVSNECPASRGKFRGTASRSRDGLHCHGPLKVQVPPLPHLSHHASPEHGSELIAVTQHHSRREALHISHPPHFLHSDATTVSVNKVNERSSLPGTTAAGTPTSPAGQGPRRPPR